MYRDRTFGLDFRSANWLSES